MGLTLAEVGGWPTVLGKLAGRHDLTADEASAALGEVLRGEATHAQIAALITLVRAKGETVTELAAFVTTMLDFAEPVRVSGEILDTCGTGGSPQRRAAAFNTSTIGSFVAAGAGARIAKHGGPAASATSGSADLLAALGVEIGLGPRGVAHCVEEVGMGFCFAPRFHPAAAHARPVRRELGIPTVFNFINPLANPARPRRQMVGVSDPALAPTMLGVLRQNGTTRAMIVYGHDGLDELTTTTTSTVLEWSDGEERAYDVDPAKLGIPLAYPAELRGGDTAANVGLCERVLGGEPGPHRDLVVLNAAAMLVTGGVAADMATGLELARASIDEGKAAGVLERLVEASKAALAADEPAV